MNLKPLSANMTEIEIGSLKVLFSYNTPVACIKEIDAYRTNKKWSNTTSKHINKWLQVHPEVLVVQYRPQEYFDNLLNQPFLFTISNEVK
jgi:hypothetical protein